MTRIGSGGAVLALALGLAACGKPAGEPAASNSGAALPAASATTAGTKPPAFAQCAACHAVQKGMHGVGPSLAGVFGTKAGDVPGYAFSDAMKGSGLVWDEKTLDAYLTNPMKVVPGTRMTYYGMSDPADRKAVIDYLKTLK